mgnify:CR=1 FL=1
MSCRIIFIDRLLILLESLITFVLVSLQNELFGGSFKGDADSIFSDLLEPFDPKLLFFYDLRRLVYLRKIVGLVHFSHFLGSEGLQFEGFFVLSRSRKCGDFALEGIFYACSEVILLGEINILNGFLLGLALHRPENVLGDTVIGLGEVEGLEPVGCIVSDRVVHVAGGACEVAGEATILLRTDAGVMDTRMRLSACSEQAILVSLLVRAVSALEGVGCLALFGHKDPLLALQFG